MAGIGAVCVFCGSSESAGARYRDVARELGTLIAVGGITLIYGGGSTGLMGEVADAAISAGGEVTGVIPAGLFRAEICHAGLTQRHDVGSMHERKQLMYRLADGFIALPGGLGTLEELAEATTWCQIGLHAKPVVLLDVDGFWQALAAQLDQMVEAGFLAPAGRTLMQRAETARQALDLAAAFSPA
jgi:uncharacterized protein (TIGR00730 family)